MMMGSNSQLANKLTYNDYITSCLLTCSFDGLIVACTLLIKFGYGEQSYGSCSAKILKPSLVIVKDPMLGNYHCKRLALLVGAINSSPRHEFSSLLTLFSKPYSKSLYHVFYLRFIIFFSLFFLFSFLFI